MSEEELNLNKLTNLFPILNTKLYFILVYFIFAPVKYLINNY